MKEKEQKIIKDGVCKREREIYYYSPIEFVTCPKCGYEILSTAGTCFVCGCCLRCG